MIDLSNACAGKLFVVRLPRRVVMYSPPRMCDAVGAGALLDQGTRIWACPRRFRTPTLPDQSIHLPLAKGSSMCSKTVRGLAVPTLDTSARAVVSLPRKRGALVLTCVGGRGIHVQPLGPTWR